MQGMIVAVLLGVPLACGDGGRDSRANASPSTTAVARADWSEQLDATCVALNKEYADLATASPSNRQEAIDHARSVEEYTDALVGALDDAGVPSADRDAADQMVVAADRLASAADDLAGDAARGDSEGVDAAADDIRAAGAEINRLAASLDLPACGGF
jgi:hypothetical protein